MSTVFALLASALLSPGSAWPLFAGTEVNDHPEGSAPCTTGPHDAELVYVHPMFEPAEIVPADVHVKCRLDG
ncbi:MAG: hypothetical protein KY455_04585 [Euryarchaeota archaeon]|nr:hypothetical protein [Euryarchaeota archaeon]